MPLETFEEGSSRRPCFGREGRRIESVKFDGLLTMSSDSGENELNRIRSGSSDTEVQTEMMQRGHTMATWLASWRTGVLTSLEVEDETTAFACFETCSTTFPSDES